MTTRTEYVMEDRWEGVNAWCYCGQFTSYIEASESRDYMKRNNPHRKFRIVKRDITETEME